VFYAGLRAYRDLMRIESARLGLRRSIEAISQIYDSRSMRSFASAVLEQVNQVLDLRGQGLCASHIAAYTANNGNGVLRVLAATDAYAQLMEGDGLSKLPPHVHQAIEYALTQKTGHYGERLYVGYFKTNVGSENIIYMEFPDPINQQAQELLEIFSHNVAIAYDTMLQREDTEQALRATVAKLENLST
jgi:hypothetical protein